MQTSAKESDPAVYDKAWEVGPTDYIILKFQTLKKADGILVPGGFGDRGVEGMLLAINYARMNNIPFFGICLGMQVHMNLCSTYSPACSY